MPVCSAVPGGSGENEVSVTVVASELRRYGVWDGGLAQDGSLFPRSGEAAPSLLFLTVSDPQAWLIHTELMEIQSIHRPGETPVTHTHTHTHTRGYVHQI